ncbi:Response regulator of zinc sigma-54-dependent two-component system [Olavius algarvensis Delta 1 endosymbiont]|nr:Response regulator of zinc sigma-54-dependent two-component system [Olavius algarvensis Delta 1 endosymbiont]
MGETQSSIMHKDIFDSTSNGVIATDTQGRIVLFNQQAVEILKTGDELVAGRAVIEVLPMTGTLVMKCLQTGEAQLGHHVHGKSFSLVANITPIRRNGQIIGCMCNFQPMQQFEDSARKLESYVKLNKELEAIFQASADGIVVYDGDGRVVSINEVAARYDGVEADEVIGMHYTDMIKAGILDRSVVPEVLKAKKKVSALVKVPRTNKTLLVNGSPAFDDAGNISLVVVNFHDMTQLNNILEQLEQSRMVVEKYQEELAELSLDELEKHEIVMESESMRQVVQMAVKLAKMEVSNILISGESGTGKGLLAKFIHKSSQRAKRPLIQINCAAVPENLLEAELFGYEKGAFTGANDRGKAGLFELAHEGTLFLDEIGDMPLLIQAKLLKYLDDYVVMRLGSVKPKTINCTIIAATNRNLAELVKDKKFREDLFYRLNTFPIEIPPLRKRPEDVFELTRYYLRKYNTQFRVKKKITTDGIEKMQSYPFRGNVRELKNILKKAVVLSEQQKIDPIVIKSLQMAEGKGEKFSPPKRRRLKLTDEILALEKQMIKEAMKHCRNLREIAHELGISEPTAFRKMKKHGLSF